MISIQQWFNKTTKGPIIIGFVLIFLFLSLINILFRQSANYQQESVVESLAKTLSVAVSQKNRTLIENVLENAMIQLQATHVALCEGTHLIAGLNVTRQSCYNKWDIFFDLPAHKDIHLLVNQNQKWKNLSFLFVFILSLTLILSIFLILRHMNKKIQNEILTPLKKGFLLDEKLSISELESIRVSLIENQKIKIERNILKATETLAKQVAHDIRSPLSALNMVAFNLDQIPEERRLLIRNSIQRINDIANGLLQKSKFAENQQSSMSIKTDSQLVCGATEDNEAIKARFNIELLPAIVDSIVSEKRMQFRGQINVSVESDLTTSYGAFANVDGAQLKRVISNLINNSVEAFPNQKGNVLVRVKKENDSSQIIISDNGKGIPKHILEKLGERGVSHGKEGTQSGSGLGVYHAKKTIEAFGGKFQIDSQENTGTHVTITFPKVGAPVWFVENLVIPRGATIVSVDDDLSIHGIWRGRVQLLGANSNEVKHLPFTSGAEFKKWLLAEQKSNKDSGPNKNNIYLIDYEFSNQHQTGLDLIEELKIEDKSILITSRYEEDNIRERCQKLGVKLIPKPMAGFAPFKVERS